MTARALGRRLAIVCDGCGAEVLTEANHADYQRAMDSPEGEDFVRAALNDVGLLEQGGLHYHQRCAELRAADPSLYVAGRVLPLSEVERLAAEGDEQMIAALAGDYADVAREQRKQASR